ncbi:hypothetical protein KSP40_PGU006745 [Platanthera guangdongensis]|uniref:Trichome birefringence-like N-terminal domain-containing protein n=1 Tax=Platanthera guangdongensis TaxID=2320717 RepID=A0ABR2LYL0_9ASPA
MVTEEETSSPQRGKEGGAWNMVHEMVQKFRPRVSTRGAWGLRRGLGTVVAIICVVILVLFAYIIAVGSENGGGLWREAAMVRFRATGMVTKACDLFEGSWVYDNLSYPLYKERMCRFMSDQSACQKFGRENLKYQNWRWKPRDCDLPRGERVGIKSVAQEMEEHFLDLKPFRPGEKRGMVVGGITSRFNATQLLERLRGKRLAFVGDSLNRNQWISMICLLDSVIPDQMKSMEANGSLTTFKAKEYDASIEFFWAPLLVESNSDDPVHHRIPDRIIRAQSIERHGRHWMGADILVFNSYLWWRREKMKVLWGAFDDKDGIYKEIEILRSYEMALKTWAEWLEFHVDHLGTKLFFMSLSPTHFWGDEWGIDSSQNCYNETEPNTGEGHMGRGSDRKMMHVVESAIRDLRERGVNVQMLNITHLSEYRKDGHPSTYRKQWDPLTTEELANPSSYADCIHWCLPGVPDVWNEILYSYILFK